MKTSMQRRQQRKRASQREKLRKINEEKTLNGNYPQSIYDQLSAMRDAYARTHQPMPLGTLASMEALAPKKKENTMNFANIVEMSESIPTDQIQKSYLTQELRDSLYRKSEEAQIFFGLENDKSPKTAKELVARITSGMYVLPSEDKDGETNYTPYVVERIQWRDPAKVKNEDGYKAFKKTLEAAKRDAERAIVIKTPDEGLAAVVAFEAIAIA